MHGDQHGPRVRFIIRPHAVQGTLALAIDQTTRIWFVVGILFDDFSSGNALESLLNRNPVGRRLFVGMIGSPDSVHPYGFGNQVKVDQELLPYQIKRAVYSSITSTVEIAVTSEFYARH